MNSGSALDFEFLLEQLEQGGPELGGDRFVFEVEADHDPLAGVEGDFAVGLRIWGPSFLRAATRGP